MIKAEAHKRLTDMSSFRTGIEISSGELFLAMPRQLSLLSERLLRAERRVSRLWRELPGIARRAYVRGLIINEVVSTNEIEGVHGTRRQIEEVLESIQAPPSKYRQRKRFKELAGLYLELTGKGRITPETPGDVRKIYDTVVAGELEASQLPDGHLFRKEPVDVVDQTGKVIHKGVAPETKITTMLEQMIALVGATDIPPTLSAIIAHFLFEYIHPFYDGNGRIGRCLLALHLSEPLSLATVLSLSTVIADNKRKYYQAFEVTEASLNHAEATFFVIQMMEFIRLAQDSVIEELESKAILLERAQGLLEDFRKAPYALSSKELNVLFQAVQHFLFGAFEEISLCDVVRHLKVGAQTARKYTRVLEEKGLLEQVSVRPLRFKLTSEAVSAFDIAVG